MGVNCCSHEKEAPEITINKPEKNITAQNQNLDKTQPNNLVVINPNQNNQSSRSNISNVNSSNVMYSLEEQNIPKVLNEQINYNNYFTTDNSNKDPYAFTEKEIQEILAQTMQNSGYTQPTSQSNINAYNQNIIPNNQIYQSMNIPQNQNQIQLQQKILSQSLPPNQNQIQYVQQQNQEKQIINRSLPQIQQRQVINQSISQNQQRQVINQPITQNQQRQLINQQPLIQTQQKQLINQQPIVQAQQKQIINQQPVSQSQPKQIINQQPIQPIVQNQKKEVISLPLTQIQQKQIINQPNEQNKNQPVEELPLGGLNIDELLAKHSNDVNQQLNKVINQFQSEKGIEDFIKQQPQTNNQQPEFNYEELIKQQNNQTQPDNIDYEKLIEQQQSQSQPEKINYDEIIKQQEKNVQPQSEILNIDELLKQHQNDQPQSVNLNIDELLNKEKNKQQENVNTNIEELIKNSQPQNQPQGQQGENFNFDEFFKDGGNKQIDDKIFDKLFSQSPENTQHSKYQNENIQNPMFLSQQINLENQQKNINSQQINLQNNPLYSSQQITKGNNL